MKRTVGLGKRRGAGLLGVPQMQLARPWTIVGLMRIGIKFSSKTLLYQSLYIPPSMLRSPQASLGQHVTVWDSILFRLSYQKATPGIKMPLTIDKEMAFNSLDAVRPFSNIDTSHKFIFVGAGLLTGQVFRHLPDMNYTNFWIRHQSQHSCHQPQVAQFRLKPHELASIR